MCQILTPGWQLFGGFGRSKLNETKRKMWSHWPRIASSIYCKLHFRKVAYLNKARFGWQLHMNLANLINTDVAAVAQEMVYDTKICRKTNVCPRWESATKSWKEARVAKNPGWDDQSFFSSSAQAAKKNWAVPTECCPHGQGCPMANRIIWKNLTSQMV